MGLASDFGMLFILDARDRAEATIKKADRYLNEFAGTAERTGAAAKAAGDEIDSSLLKTASSADALELASARVAGAQEKQKVATDELAAAERELLAVRAKETPDAGELSAATDKLAGAEKRAATASKELRDAEKLQADTAKAAAATTEESAAKNDVAAASADKSKSALGKLGKTAATAGLGVLLAGGYMVKAAGDFQSSTEHLVTDAGESQSQLGRVQKGMLDISVATGTSASAMSAGMYHIESSIPPMTDKVKRAGIALNDLKVAAEGAKVGNADLDTVSKTLVGTMNSYSAQNYSATQVMNALITTVGSGDMKMQDLASSLGNVAPLAAAAGLSFSQVGGAIATMTSQNMSADQATQDLANTIRNLQKPNQAAINEMQSLGLNSNDVAQSLGKRGLTGTLQMLTQAVAAHTKGGQVLISSFRASGQAAADADKMMQSMPADLQKLAEAYLKGGISAKDWRTDLQGLSPINQNLMRQFAGVADKTHAFNDLLAKGGPAAQTYNAAMGSMLGGATGLNTALMLGGSQMQTFQANTDKVQKSLTTGGAAVDNWTQIQGTFNQKMDVAKASIQATAIQIGTALMPAAEGLLKTIQSIITPIAAWVSKHQQLAGELFKGTVAVLGAVAALGALNKVFGTVKTSVQGVASVFKGVGKLLDLFSGSADAAAASADGAAASADGLAASEEGAATATEASTVAADENALATDRSALASAAAAIKTGLVTAAQKTAAVAAGAWREAQAALHVVMQSTIESLDNFTALLNGASGAEDAAAASADGAAASADGLAASEDGAAAATEASTVAQDANSGSLIRSGLAAAGAAAKFVIVKTAQMAVTLATKAWTAAQWLFNAAMNASPIMLVVTALAALAGGIIYAYTHFQAFRDVVKKVWDWIKTAVVDTINFVKDHWELIVQIFTGPIGIVATKIYDHWSTIKRYFMDGVHAVEHILSWFGTLPGDFKRWWGDISRAVSSGVSTAMSFIAGIPGRVRNAIFGFFDGLADWFGAKIGAAASTVGSKIGDLVGWFDKLGGKVLDAVSNFGSLLIHAGEDLVKGLIQGVENMGSSAIDSVKNLGSSMVHGISSMLGIGSPSRVMADQVGKWIPAGIAQGIAANVGVLRSALTGAASLSVTTAQASLSPGTVAQIPAAVPTALPRAGAGSTVNNFRFDFGGAHVSSERDMELLANKVSAAVARILPIGGLRVAM